MVGCLPQLASAQRLAGEWAWKPVVTQDSVAVRYIFYHAADNENNGVVLRLDNLSAQEVEYRFIALFKGDGREFEEEVTGSLKAHETVTGDADGLFFIPFPDGGEVEQIGLRGFRVRAVVRGASD